MIANNNRGKVYLVGAGLGSPDYLTLRGQHLLQSAEVVVFDALVAPQVLQFVPQDCLRIWVGKRGGKRSTPQAEINRLLVKHCQQGKQVVRLKGGDPGVFGRSRGEVEALRAAGCPFEVVPGISSALAAPLLAGIALTDKLLSSCFAVITAHQPETLDWKALARLDTLVVLMGGRNLEPIVRQLKAQGRSRAIPIAIIRNGGRANQQVWQGTLADILDRTAGISLSPCVIVIGPVVSLEPMQSHSPTSQTLQGQTILVTRAAGQSSTFTQLLQQQGAEVLEMPALEIRPPSSWQQLDEAIARLSDFNWLILTSSNGVDYFFSRLASSSQDARSLANLKIAVVGKKTAAALKQQHLKPDFIPPNYVADSLIEHFPEPLDGKTILFPRVETGGRDVLVKALSARGATVVEVPAYQSACPNSIDPIVARSLYAKTIDIITFASSKTARNFCTLLAREWGEAELPNVLQGVGIASIGPQTSKSCQEQLQRVDIEAQEYTLEGLTAAIVRWVTEKKA